MTVSTHVLDTRLGRPARGVPVRLDRHDGGGWQHLAEGATDEHGRWAVPDAGAGTGADPAADPGTGAAPEPGTYRLRFGAGPYFAALAVATCYPEVSVIFSVPADGGPRHVPLLLGPFGYSTYSGGRDGGREG
ncbi:hydroxyisourate hydrolase [Actinomadura roseirufa]|uniref:hydroxyisourate hydrolase n=1 Tax=Actinomadura roseirufa TaxID=2094049 RepID=UPI0010413797|nr:hydroxyisourate hydrolase [Actinomadura roseirufa]